MELTRYRKMRAGVQANASPGPVVARREAVEKLRSALLETGLFDEVEVDQTDNPDSLVIAMCTFAETATPAQVSARLESVWQSSLRYGFWEAHALLADRDQVELQGATRTGTDGHYLTLHVVAQKARIPTQRIRR